jgi:hypothetical protein
LGAAGLLTAAPLPATPLGGATTLTPGFVPDPLSLALQPVTQTTTKLNADHLNAVLTMHLP